MPKPPRSARSERTSEALRRAAHVRFLAQGVDETSAEQIAADAGVSLRTFYRHFASKHDLLFGDYDASLEWFRSALDSRPMGEGITEAVLAAIHSFPYDHASMFEIAALRERALDREHVEKHIHQVEAEFAIHVERHLLSHSPPAEHDAPFLATVAARCIAAATFAAVDTWMRGDHTDLEELARLTELALKTLQPGVVPRATKPARAGSVKFDETPDS